jgi:hypothetical protein
MIGRRLVSWGGIGWLVVTGVGGVPGAQAQTPPTNPNPDSARLVTADIPRFWRVFDRASLRDAGQLFQADYLDSGSVGLADFARFRVGNGSRLAGTVASHARYYAAIRRNTLSIDTSRTIKASIRLAFQRLKLQCADAVFPDVYFVVGRLNAGGTTSAHGMLIGVEMDARDDTTPVDQLSAWENSATGRLADLAPSVAHELIHIQQSPSPTHPTLLDQAFREGSADFLGELISGANTTPAQHTYGDAHEMALWGEFTRAMGDTDVSRWLYQGDQSKDRPADLGYYVGYRIAQSLFRHAADKHDAVCRLMRAADPRALLRESRYAGAP